MSSGASETIIKNTLFNAAGRFWGILISILLTPYILAHVGVERYGIWAIVGVITGYFNLLDFGMGTSYVKYISEYRAKRDQEGIDRLVSTGVIVYSAFAVLVIPAAYLLAPGLLGLFRIPPAFFSEAVFVLRLGVALLVVSNALSVFGAIPQGLQRMDVSNKIAVGVSLPMVLGTVFFLEKGYGLRGLMLNNAVVLALAGAANIFAAFRVLPGLRVGLSRFSGEMFARLFSFGFKMQFSKIAEVLVFQTDRLLIAYFIDVISVGLYQLGSSIAQQVRQLPLLLVSAVLPAASDLDAKNDQDRLRELYLRGSKYLALASFPVFFFVIAAAGRLMAVWVGPGYERSAWVLQILAVGYLANLLAGVGTSVAAAIGRPEFQMGAAIISAVSNIALTLALVKPAGFFGVAAASAVSLILGPLYFFVKLHAKLRLDSGKIAREALLVPLYASALPAALLYSVNRWIEPSQGRAGGGALLLAEGLAFLLVYAAIVLRRNCLDSYDLNLARAGLASLLPPGGWWGKRC
ncbi:MAG: hypothetical protein A2X32_06100 [Elusimicrobia bacterium GWC2_64_44]|nr:MAG: hypothetical protein A2X32_06100 [Elusimicrobia bacterium GWC2_64_44]